MTRLEQGYKGPLAQLKVNMDSQVRVKCYVRKEHGVRGTITGLIEAFDKHWNLVISDATEVWKRRKLNFSDQNTAFTSSIPESQALKKLARMGIKVPTVAVKSLDRKHVSCTRQVAQLMVRGEQIVLVTRDEAVKKDWLK